MPFLARLFFKLSGLQIKWLLLGSFTYFFAAKLGMAIFALQPSNITILWLPSGIGLVMYLQLGRSSLPFILLASYLANISGMQNDSVLLQIIHTLIAATVDTFTAWFAATMLVKRLPNGLNDFRSLGKFCLYVCIFPVSLSSIALSLNLLIGGYISIESTPAFIGMLLGADSLGILLIYPLFEAWKNSPAIESKMLRQWSIEIILILIIVYLSFNHISGLIFLIPPIVIFQAMRTQNHLTLMTLIITVSVILFYSSKDLGPFHLQIETQGQFMLITFLFSVTSVVLGMSLLHQEIASETSIRRTWQFRANHDSLTGLANRQYFLPLLNNEINRSLRNSHTLSIAMIDIDDFKKINDTYGHLFGDEVLMWLANKIQKTLRDTDIAARFGGEEFIILFPETTLKEAENVMYRLMSDIKKDHLSIANNSVSLTISVGLTDLAYHPNPTNENIIHHADELLYKAKKMGKNKVVLQE